MRGRYKPGKTRAHSMRDTAFVLYESLLNAQGPQYHCRRRVLERIEGLCGLHPWPGTSTTFDGENRNGNCEEGRAREESGSGQEGRPSHQGCGSCKEGG